MSDTPTPGRGRGRSRPPPIGAGGGLREPRAFGSFTDSRTQAVPRPLPRAGASIAAIDTLTYRITVPAGDGESPAMQLAVVTLNHASNVASLVVIADANGNVAPISETRVDYEPADSGFVASIRDVRAPNDSCLICRPSSAPLTRVTAPRWHAMSRRLLSNPQI